jgi:(p)ppGpp synthase/HD superfamily hydrolase
MQFMTPSFTQALTLAARAHEGQRRKGTSIPYITHPVIVAGLVAEYGGDEDLQIAGLLHDVLEDAGAAYSQAIQAQFGDRVLSVVRSCTDGVPDEMGKKAPWTDRKRAYLAHLKTADADTILVSGCDKLSNARAILDDLVSIGPAVFDRFNAKMEGTVWYYEALSAILTERKAPMAKVLSDTVVKIIRLAQAG